jgi:cell division septum initiation protein DivIVA
MRKALVTLIILVAVAEAAVIVALSQHSQVSTLEIDRDRAAITEQINEGEREAAKYSGGAIKTFVELRLAILKNTKAMLDQKRTSLIRIIPLNYTIDGHTAREASDKELSEILEELAQSEKAIEGSKQEAARYSGGLIQVMTLMKAATEEVTASSLRMKFYAMKYGIPLHLPSPDRGPPDRAPTPASPGTIVKDREAL